MKILNEKEYEQLKVNISEWGLDPVWLNYGGFVSEVNPLSWSPENRHIMEPFTHMYRISVGPVVYSITKDEHCVLINEEQQKNFVEFLAKEQQKKKYKKWFKDKFNCFTFEATLYYKEIRKSGMNPSWWYTVKSENLLPLNADEKRIQEAKEELNTRVKSMYDKAKIKYVGYEIKKVYKSIHYRDSSEWADILTIVHGTNGINKHRHPTHQMTRHLIEDLSKERLKSYKEYTLPSSKRKVLFNVHTWGINYVETEPIII